MAADGDGTPTGFHECHEDGSGGSGMAVWPGTVGVDGKFFFFLFLSSRSACTVFLSVPPV